MTIDLVNQSCHNRSMTLRNASGTAFWTQNQNNSGGSFDHNPEFGIGYAVCVEAATEKEASERLVVILDRYPDSGSCECCGERWSMYWDDEDGAPVPQQYDEPLKGDWGIPSYVHYRDGRIEAVEP